jgi:hypothetical protein
VKGEWDSARDAGRDVDPLCCGSCYTETVISFRLVGEQTLVSIQVYKDLGMGLHPGDAKWLALTKGTLLARPMEDLLRMRREYEVMHEEEVRGEAGQAQEGQEQEVHGQEAA